MGRVKIAPNWITMVYIFQYPLPRSICINASVILRCAVELTGKNSVSPSTIPKTTLNRYSLTRFPRLCSGRSLNRSSSSPFSAPSVLSLCVRCLKNVSRFSIQFPFSIFSFPISSSSHTHQSSPNNIFSPPLPYDIHDVPRRQSRFDSLPTFPATRIESPETQNAVPFLLEAASQRPGGDISLGHRG